MQKRKQVGSDLEKWQFGAVVIVVGLVAISLVVLGWKRVAVRRRSRHLIAAARVRSGYVPGGLQIVRGGFSGSTGMGRFGPASALRPLATNAGEFDEIVDERPLIHIRYQDALAKKIDAKLQVEHLDLQKGLVVGYCGHPGDTRRIPLSDIVRARIAANGQRFDVDTWIDAVRVARRRRGQG